MQYDGEMITEPQADEGITKVEWLFPDELNRIKSSAWLSLDGSHQLICIESNYLSPLRLYNL